MKPSSISVALVLALLLAPACVSHGKAGADEASNPAKDACPKRHIHGPFEVKLEALSDGPTLVDSSIIGRKSIDKQFHGELEAVSQGQMLAVRTEVKGSAGYVALERVIGTLDGRSGSFVLQHSSQMIRGVPHQSISVVPDSGTEQLVGLLGSMTIDINSGKHSYDFEYWFEPQFGQ